MSSGRRRGRRARRRRLGRAEPCERRPAAWIADAAVAPLVVARDL